MSSNLGKWNPAYSGIQPGSDPIPYAATDTYRLGAEWLLDCSSIEDWGCGTGWLRQFVPASRYRGIDGSSSPFADVITDLAEYRSSVPGIFMRHVLEHNEDWSRVLDNAVASFTRRMALILFTPMGEETRKIAPFSNGIIDVPNISFRHEDLAGRFDDAVFTFEDYSTASFYGTERIYYLEKS